MGGSGGGYAPTIRNNNCSTLAFKATLNSPQAVASWLKPGDVVTLSLQQGKILTAVFNGQVIGSITGHQLQRLISCIDNGYSYVGDVFSISGGRVVLEVRANV
ncbi:hypothetical protein BZG05_01585 [Salinivibrio kushneri]|uniref:hypothetical protein n=1 Tax=Salinivibrio kushneri TaxID=1908198 RepID=UPI0009891F48|nr:hypothetical protein [Salinivibrio kushneri]OOE36201.1 hypothetical protein BZG05_01585 [Salinivibrio kushneri]